MKKAVHFGGGNIGRGLIGLLLNREGYRIQFVDVNERLVELLRTRGEYVVQLANEESAEMKVDNVTAINGNDREQVAQAIADADLVTTAVGVDDLEHIAGNIALGIRRRLAQSPRPLHVIACENTIGDSTTLKNLVYEHLPAELHDEAKLHIAFPDASVDRIVALQQNEESLKVIVEPFYEWLVDRSAMFPNYDEIEGVHYADKLHPYIERKLFTVYTGRSTAAYHGYLSGYKSIQEAMNDKKVLVEVIGALGETGAALRSQYEFDSLEHDKYIGKILDRFRNPYLTHEIVRVGRSPIRKLSSNERFVRPALIAHEAGIEVPHLAKAMAAALLFDYPEDPEAVELQQSLRQSGTAETVTRYAGLPPSHPLHGRIVAEYESFQERK